MKIHVVKQGDTLEGIAGKYQTDPNVLMDFNPALRSDEPLSPGMKIKIPAAPKPVMELGVRSMDQDEGTNTTDTNLGEESPAEFFNQENDPFFSQPASFPAQPVWTQSFQQVPPPFPPLSSIPAGFQGLDWMRMYYPSAAGFTTPGNYLPYSGYSGYSGYPSQEQSAFPPFPPFAATSPFQPVTEEQPPKSQQDLSERKEADETDSVQSKRNKKRFHGRKVSKKKQGRTGDRPVLEKSAFPGEKVNLPWLNF